MTQGGLQSIEEAISRGVPMVVIPFFYDQYDNAEMVQRKQIGIRLYRDYLTVDTIKAAIEEVMHNPMYRRNILRLRNAIRDEPMEPREKVAWWLEHTIRHKEEIQQMRYEGADLPFVQKYFVDVGISVIFVVSLAIFILRLCCYYCTKFVMDKIDLVKMNIKKEKSL